MIDHLGYGRRDQAGLSLYANGMTTGDIANHLQDAYGDQVSRSLVFRVTDQILHDMGQWQTRPLPGSVRTQAAAEQSHRPDQRLEVHHEHPRHHLRRPPDNNKPANAVYTDGCTDPAGPVGRARSSGPRLRGGLGAGNMPKLAAFPALGTMSVRSATDGALERASHIPAASLRTCSR